jgi:DNA-binding NarL/FixJ family response regulator
MAPRVYICDANPRMQQLIAERLHGQAEIVGKGATAREAIHATAELEPDLVVLDYRTTVSQLAETITAIKAPRPSTAVVVHTGVPRSLIEDEIEAAGGVYSPKNEPEHLSRLVRGVSPAAEAASRGS